MRSILVAAVLALAASPVVGLAYANVVTVAKNGTGDYGYGDPRDAIAAAGTPGSWCPAPSAAAPCLVKLAPGRYDLGPNEMQMKDYVDVEGSGEGVTTIVGSWLYVVDFYTTVARPEIRSLTIEHQGDYAWAAAVFVYAGKSARLSNATVKSTGSISSTEVGIRNRYGDCELRHVTISMGGTGSQYAVYNEGTMLIADSTITGQATGPNRTYGVFSEGTLRVTHSSIRMFGTGSYGMENRGAATLEGVRVECDYFGLNMFYGTLNIHASQIIAQNPLRADINTTARVGASMLSGLKLVDLGTKICVASYDGNFQPLSSTCQ